MTENIELKSLPTSAAGEGDIEEYHEINLEELNVRPKSSTHSAKIPNEYDFFTQYDNKKTGKKGTIKKKKGKKKDKAANLMDLVNSELASATLPIEENVVTFVNYTAEQRNSYLVTTPREQKIIRRRSVRFDFEQGWGQKESAVNLNPTFPKVLENVATNETDIPVAYIKPVLYSDILAEANNDAQESTKFIDIEIQDIKFKHHHHFTLEKLLSLKLGELYEQYNNIKKTIKDIDTEIKINRDTRDNLKKDLLKVSPNKKEEVRFDQTVRKYTGNVLELKEKYFKMLQEEKEIIHKLCIVWCDLEMVREKTGITDTLEVLVLSKNSLSEEDYEKEWNEVFNREFSDMLDKVEFEYVNKYIEYKEVKYTQNLDDSTKKRIAKPKLNINEETLKEEVEELVNNIVLKDKIEALLKKDERILTETIESERESKYYFEVYVDDIYVCASEHISCKDHKISDIAFSDSLSVQILPKNTIIRIVMSENKRQVSDLKITLADVRKDFASSEFVTHTLIYNELLEANDKSVGSGHNIKEIASQNKVRLKSSNVFKGNFNTTCEIKIKMGWSENCDKKQVEAVKTSMEIGRQIKRLIHGVDKPTTDGLAEVIRKIYNRDVINDEEVLKTLRNLAKTEIKIKDTFDIDENSADFIRLKLLHLRNKGGMTDVENKMIPIHASQISTDLLNCLQKSKENDFDLQYFLDKNLEMDPIELQRFIGVKYVKKLNENMLKNLNEYLLRKTHKDVVRDFKDLSLRSLFSNSTNLALANISSNKKRQLLSEACSKEQEIKITFMRAFNLPDRSASIEEVDEEDEIAGFKVRPLRPFVKVSYNGVSAQTTAAIGCHPSWTQTLNIKAKPTPLSSIHINVYDEHKSNISDGSDEESGRTVHYRFSHRWIGALQVPLHAVLTLGNFKGTFKLITPPMLFGYENYTQTRQSNQSLVPAIAQIMKKDSSFISVYITTSLSHLGAYNSYDQPIPNSEDDYLVKHLNNFVTEYINDFPNRHISLTFIDSSGKNKCVTQFLQPIHLPDAESFPKNPKSRSESALSKSSVLSKSSSSKSSGKKRSEDRVSYAGEEREKESIYSTMSWKAGDNHLEKLMTACARYVSLIPTYEVTDSHTVTLLGLELLKVLHGSALDHTILLASYFLYLGIHTWIAVGLGLPRGKSSYVLTKFDQVSQRMVLMTDHLRSRSFLSKHEGYAWQVYDAVSGERSELRDVGCPLKTVDFVFDNENIWVNVQSSRDCEHVCFDLSKSSDWQTVFGKSVFVMRQPVVSEPNLYTNTADVERLRQYLENKIKAKIQKWRPHMKTIWNRYCSSLLRETLPQWEYWTFNTTTEPKPVLTQRLKQLMATYKMFGFPLNMAFVSTKSVISTIKATGVHSVSDPSVEFGLAVEVYAYPNNVLSVWVFLASITRI